ncbi:ATP phosphoribosyltransferase regulatory subunit [Macrococcus animalis]|uniref:ATP phosphoribosyltransferase regulatory subunit n=1 Tax=Macrococcus animalis TaxID=3395467 RepID=UPI0039BF62CD
MFIKNNNTLLQEKQLELNFLQFFDNLNYSIISSPIVETYNYNELTTDDLSSMKERSVWHYNQQMYSMRYDFTDAIRKYMHQYHINPDNVCYVGPVIRKQKTLTQFGIESFQTEQQSLIFNQFNQFINQYFNPINMVVVGSYRLLDDLLTTEQLKSLKEEIKYKNVSLLSKSLGNNHPIVKLFTLPPIEQTDYLIEQFNDLYEVQRMKEWIDIFKAQNISNIYIDITQSPKFSYYHSLFFNFYQKNADLPIATGGLYLNQSEAIGFALNPDNGVTK